MVEDNILFTNPLAGKGLNHLIASRMANNDWPFVLFGFNLDTRDLETYPRIYSCHFLNISIFDDSRAI